MELRNLAIDIGNTRIKLGLFSGGQCQESVYFAHEKIEGLQHWITNHSFEKVILSSVGSEAVTHLVSGFLAEAGREYLEFTTGTPVPISLDYRTPRTLGKDRLAAVVGAFALFPGKNCLVIDAGTCITYDFIDGSGCFHGGNIAPGMKMRLQSMHHYTARLPLPEAQWPADWIGKTTESALQNGGLFGILLEMEGYQRLSKERWGDINVLLTGGDSHFLAKKWKSHIFVNQNLVLHGLNKILDYNVERSK